MSKQQTRVVAILIFFSSFLSFFLFFLFFFSILASGIDEGRYSLHVGENIRQYRLHASPETQIVVRVFEIFHNKQYVNILFLTIFLSNESNQH